MNLTAKQLDSLRIDLLTLAGIEYDDVMANLLGQYATLTEENMADGFSFEDASKWAWAKLGSGSGIQAIQHDYEKAVNEQIRRRHKAILLSYFGWPTIIGSILALALFCLLTPLATDRTMLALLSFCGVFPSLMLAYGFRKHMDQQTDHRKISWAYLRKAGSTAWYVVYLIGLNPLFLDRETSAIWLFRLHPVVGASLCWVALLYLISFIQLFKEHFPLNVAAVFDR